MRKRKYTQNLNCPVTEEMFKELTETIDKLQITFSEFIRTSIQKHIEDVKDE